MRGHTAESNLKLLQSQHNIILRKFVGAPFYVTNRYIHRDLHLDTVDEYARHSTVRFVTRLHRHSNTIALQLSENPETRRLKRQMPLDMAWRINATTVHIYYTSFWWRAFGAPRGSAPMVWYYDSQLRSSLRSLLAPPSALPKIME